MVKKIQRFLKIFQKRYIELPILDVVIIEQPSKLPIFFQVVLIIPLYGAKVEIVSENLLKT